MSLQKEYACSECGKIKNRKKLRNINKSWICIPCQAEKRKEKRDYLLHEVLGVRRRSELEKEWRRNRAEKKKLMDLRNTLHPKIKGSREEMKKTPKSIYFYLTFTEKQVLFKKYIGLGLPEELADKRVKDIVKSLHELVEKLREKRLEEKEIGIRFREEFAKICMQPEAK